MRQEAAEHKSSQTTADGKRNKGGSAGFMADKRGAATRVDSWQTNVARQLGFIVLKLGRYNRGTHLCWSLDSI